MNKALDLIKKNKEFILYGFFGVCTTIVNIVVYAVCYNVLNISNVVIAHCIKGYKKPVKRRRFYTILFIMI